MRWRTLGRVLGVMTLLIGLAGGALYVVTENRLNHTVDVPRESIAVPGDLGAVRRGQHLAAAVAACSACHGANLAGNVLVDDPRLARIVPPNLTRGRGGVGAVRSDDELARAIRHGVDPTGRMLLVMPSDNYNHFSDGDLGAIVAYLRALPAIDTALSSNQVRSLGRALFGLGLLELQPAATIDHFGPRPAAPAAAVSIDYGKYLSDAAGCSGCHGAGLSGGSMARRFGDGVAAANITPAGLGGWSEGDFFKVMRAGIRPDGRAIATTMPWPYFAQLSDTELRAIWRFLQAVPGRETGTL